MYLWPEYYVIILLDDQLLIISALASKHIIGLRERPEYYVILSL
jgi:hypothetical protein